MKSLLTGVFLLCTFVLFAQNANWVEAEALVRGNCGMCKSNIENAVKTNNSQGNWNMETKVLTVQFDPNKTNLSRLLKRVADAGYDNEMFLADDRDYRNLAACCLYDRESSWVEYLENPIVGHEPATSTQITTETLTDPAVITHAPDTAHASPTPEIEDDVEEDDMSDIIGLQTVVSVGHQATTTMDRNSAAFTFNIKEGELLKAACCNLSESFETNATVDVSFSNAVTGTKQIKMLGLDQKYTLITKELLPDVRGLATAYGMNFIPGRWIQGIQLTKGGSTVTNGYEAITGQINTEYQKFRGEPYTAINIFGDINTRFEGNVAHTDAINDQWSQSFLLHGNATVEKMDHNHDHFLDQPIGKQLNLAYLLNYENFEKNGLATHFGAQFLIDNRQAGSMHFNSHHNPLTSEHYGVNIDITRFVAWNKTGYIFKDKPYQSIGFTNQYIYHDQKSFFGRRSYDGKQNSFNSNLIFESILGSTMHQYKAGLSFLYDQFDEMYNFENIVRTETAPGAFAEYTYNGDRFTAVAGVRYDLHNLAGSQFTPRLNLKYDLAPKTILRASAGRGFRTANIFAESQAYMASNRVIHWPSNTDLYGLSPEIAWNYGISLQQDFLLWRRPGTLAVDFFRTDFTNQIIPDLDRSPQAIHFYNIDHSFANSFQAQLDLNPMARLDVRMAYKYYQTEVGFADGAREMPFTPSHRAFLNLGYATRKTAADQQWTFDTTIQWVGSQRIPDTSSNPVAFQLPDRSPDFFLVNAQVAYHPSRVLRWYAGVENLLSYRQDNPILDVQNPFGNYFDGGMVYAPIMPANFYFGLDIVF
ncbi:MAG: TonB-dependent receptor [Weeksellaceae bacterium]|nr:TonB-dependent receptor [Weeksellaceae bacterium]